MSCARFPVIRRCVRIGAIHDVPFVLGNRSRGDGDKSTDGRGPRRQFSGAPVDPTRASNSDTGFRDRPFQPLRYPTPPDMCWDRFGGSSAPPAGVRPVDGMDEIASESVLKKAYARLCERRQDDSPNDEVWDLRWRLEEIRWQLQTQTGEMGNRATPSRLTAAASANLTATDEPPFLRNRAARQAEDHERTVRPRCAPRRPGDPAMARSARWAPGPWCVVGRRRRAEVKTEARPTPGPPVTRTGRPGRAGPK